MPGQDIFETGYVPSVIWSGKIAATAFVITPVSLYQIRATNSQLVGWCLMELISKSMEGLKDTDIHVRTVKKKKKVTGGSGAKEMAK